MWNFQTIFFLVFAINLWKIHGEVSDKRLCVDDRCSVQIGEGKTLVRYSSPDSRILSFAPNTPVKIFSYGAGTLPMYIGVEINGKRGYINKNHVRETRTFKRPTILLPTEYASSNSQNLGAQIEADPVKQEYEIIDGTKIPIDPGYSSTEEPLVTPTESGHLPQSTSEKTEELVLDLGKKENINTSSHTDENVVEKSDILSKTLKEPEIIDNSEEPSTKTGSRTDDKQNTNSGKSIDDFKSDKVSKEFSDEGENNNILANSKTELKEDSEESDDEDDNEDENDEEDEEEENEQEEEKEKSFLDKIVDTLESFAHDIKTELPQEKIVTEEDSQKNVDLLPKDIAENQNTDNKVENPDKGIKHNIEPRDAGDGEPISIENSAEASKENIPLYQIVSESDLPSTAPSINDYEALPLEDEVTPNPVPNLNEEEVKSGEKIAVKNSQEQKNYEAESGGKKLLDEEKQVTANSSNREGGSSEVEFIQEQVNEEAISEEQNLKDESAGGKVVVANPSNIESEVLSHSNEVEFIQEKINEDAKSEKPKHKEELVNPPIEEVEIIKDKAKEEAKAQPQNLKEDIIEPKKEADLVQEKIVTADSSNLMGGSGGLFNQPMFRTHENGNTKPLDDENKVEKPSEEMESPKNQDINIKNSSLDMPEAIVLEKTIPSSSRPNLGPNEPIFIDVVPSNDEHKRILDEDLDDNNVTEEFKISEQDLNIMAPSPPKLQENSEGIFSRLSSFFGGVSGSEEVTQSNDAGSPSYEEVVRNLDTVEEIVEEPFIKTQAYVTGAEDAISKTEDNNIKTINTQSLAADRSYPSKEVPNFSEEQLENVWSFSQKDQMDFCDTDECSKTQPSDDTSSFSLELILQSFSSEMFIYLSTTAVSMVVFLFLYLILDKCNREAPLIARINKLEQELLATKKENQLLQEQDSTLVVQQPETIIQGVPNEVMDELEEKLKQTEIIKAALEEQVSALEKELDNSTEVGIELNRIISDMLNSTDGSEILKENVEQMQKRLLEQQDTINSMNENVTLRETENYELRLELDISNKKVMDLQGEVDKMVERIVKIEEERDARQSALEKEIEVYQVRVKEAHGKESILKSELQDLKSKVTEYQRIAELKTKEYNTLKESLEEIKSVKNNKDTIKSLLEVTEIKAQLEQFKSENSRYLDQLRLEQESNVAYAKKIQSLSNELGDLRGNYESADKEKVEARTKLDVLNNYFKEKEEQMQKEISKYESLWAVKKGEATSTTERIRLLQEELQNYKTQNDSLKQEIMNQEVEMKSQISVLEKKAHESWMTIRQTERKLEEARQEAAQLRNRLTMKERAALENSNQMRIHQNGEMPLSPPPLDVTLSPPPLIGNPRDLTMSPPIPGMPPLPFLPPPPGGLPPFMPPPPPGGLPPPGMPHFMPPPIFPGDHRPPPLGRMSSPPPPNSRYSPESTIYSEYDRYDRNSPSPIYDSEYGASPPARAYSPYEERMRDERLRDDRRDYREDRRDYSRSHGRNNGRTSKGISSGSDNELGKVNRKPIKKV